MNKRQYTSPLLRIITLNDEQLLCQSNAGRAVNVNHTPTDSWGSSNERNANSSIWDED